MTRANARELAIHLVYSQDFTGQEPVDLINTRMDKAYYSLLSEENQVYSERPNRAQLAYIDNVVTGVSNRVDYLDQEIQKYSISWDITRISKLARSILRLAIFEILYVDDVPQGVAISEAVRIAKLYDGEEAGAFINGILGAYVRGISSEEK